MVAEAEPAHTGEVLCRLRAKAGLTIDEVAARAAVEPAQLASLEAGTGVRDLGYDEVLRLVRATQPPRPDWWDEGYEHDLNLGGELCWVLTSHRVDFVLFGSMAAVLRGVPIRTDDADLVPGRGAENLQRRCDALNTLTPRWRVEGFPEGLKIDGRRLEPRHFLGDSIAIGLVTSLGSTSCSGRRASSRGTTPLLPAPESSMSLVRRSPRRHARRSHRVQAATRAGERRRAPSATS